MNTTKEIKKHPTKNIALIRKEQTSAIRGQSLVEFALVLPLILFVVFGVFEFGRILFLFSEISNSTREAARFGSTTGQGEIGVANYLDCNAIRNAARQTAFLIDYNDADIKIGYERNNGSNQFGVFAQCGDAALDADDIGLGDRIVITITQNIEPILSFVPISDFPISSVSRRTVVKDIPTGPSQCRDGRDNDGDGDVDYPADTGCESADDTIEAICYRLTVTSLPTDGGANNIVPEPNCSNRFIETTNIILTANPTVGYAFDRWSGAIGGTTNPATFPIMSDSDVIANYDLLVDLAVTKSANPDPVRVGDPISYLITVSSTSVSTATEVIISEEIPPELTNVIVTPPPGGSCDFSTMPFVTCTVPVLPANGGFTMSVSGNAPLTPGTILINEVTVSLAGDHERDPDLSNNTYTVNTEVLPKVNLGVTKTAPLEPVRDQPFDYEIIISNEGPLVATGVTLTDTLPPNLDLVYVASSGLCGGTTVITCDLPDIPAGDSTIVTIRVIPTVVGFISNVVEVSGTLYDHAPENDSATADSTVRAYSNLSIEKTGTPSTVYDGQIVKYTVTVSNAPDMSTATNIVVTDILPVDQQNVDLGSITASSGTCQVTTVPGPRNDLLICNIPQLLPGEEATIFFSIEAVSPGSMVNYVDVSAAEIDWPSGGPNDDSVVTTVLATADLSVSKTASASNPVLLSPFTYTIDVTNDGPSDATGVEIRDTLPAGLEFISATAGCSAPDTNRVITCSIPTLDVTENYNPPPAETYELEITVRPTTTGVFNNIVEVSGNQLDPNTSNNESTNTVEVFPLADLSVTKEATIPVLNSPLTYTISVTNAGPSDLNNVVVVDKLPASFQFVSASPGCALIGGNQVYCSIAALNVDESVIPPTPASAQINITVLPTASGTFDNIVTAFSETDDPNSSNNTFTHTIVIPALPVSSHSKNSPQTARVAGKVNFASPTATQNLTMAKPIALFYTTNYFHSQLSRFIFILTNKEGRSYA